MTFFNIFSSDPVEQQETIHIIADHREKNSLVVPHLMRQGAKLEFEQLAVADYLVNEVAVERKTVSDLKSSIVNKRIMSQLPELKQYKKQLLVVEGITEEDIYKGIIHENALRGFLLSVALEYQIPLVFTQDALDTAKYLIVLAKKQAKGQISLRPAKIAHTKEEQLQFILEGFPHIGPVKAKALLTRFKTIKNIANASEEELREVLGTHAKEIKTLIDHVAKGKQQ